MTRKVHYKRLNYKFNKFVNTFLPGEVVPTEQEADAFKCWPYDVTEYGGPVVHHAVYDAPDAEEWQKFRVSMKTQPTSVKLFRLAQRWRHNAHIEIEKIRICNYIAALRRSGLLSIKLEVVR